MAKLLLGLLGGTSVLFFALIVVSAALGTSDSSRADTIDHAPVQPSGPDAEPVDPSDAEAVLADNPLYGQGGLANGQCPAEDLGDAGKDEQTRFYKALMSCLDDEWGAPIEAAGFAYTEPGLVVFDAPVTTPCGGASPEEGRVLAFYCPGDEVMYADVPQVRKFFGSIDVAYAILIGHEFGHHVQHETGIIDAFDAAVYDAYDQRLILNRRVELQASCMGGLFLGAIADSFPIDDSRLTQLDRAAGSFGDEPGAPDNQRDHGSGEANRAWILDGFNTNDLAVCNTFTAAGDAVD
ncbi:MAG: neutral zinc metallopeptidase [Nocardioidaceae bacterium]